METTNFIISCVCAISCTHSDYYAKFPPETVCGVGYQFNKLKCSLLLIALHTNSIHTHRERTEHHRKNANWPQTIFLELAIRFITNHIRWYLISSSSLRVGFVVIFRFHFFLSLVSVDVIWFRNLSNGFCCCSSHRSLDVGGWSFGPLKLRPCQKEWKIRRNKREKCSILSITPTSPRLFFHLIDKEKRRTTKLLSNVHNDR